MIQSYLLVATVILTTVSQSFGYSLNCNNGRNSASTTATARLSTTTTTTDESSRRQWLAQVTMIATGTAFLSMDSASAEENETNIANTKPLYSIEKCSTSSKAPCVSTANVRNLDLYLPPWTFDRSSDEVMSRLKGSIVADPSCQIVQQDGNQYLKVEAKRNDLFSTIDELEFVINDKDQVVFFRSRASNENTDFGINKKRLEDIRKRAGIFGVMGEFMNSADSASIGQRGNGPLGQLKAFYGLQSGGGFEDVVLE